MPYLNLDLEYPNHPKIRRLVGRLGPAAEILLIRLWCTVGRVSAEKGELKGYTVPEIEHMIGWTGESGKAIEALVAVHLLDEIAGGYQVHNWKEHEGHLIAFKKRAVQANRTRWRQIARRTRKEDKRPRRELSLKDPSRSGEGSPKHSLTDPPTIPTHPTQPDHTHPTQPDHTYPTRPVHTTPAPPTSSSASSLSAREAPPPPPAADGAAGAAVGAAAPGSSENQEARLASAAATPAEEDELHTGIVNVSAGLLPEVRQEGSRQREHYAVRAV